MSTKRPYMVTVRVIEIEHAEDAASALDVVRRRLKAEGFYPDEIELGEAVESDCCEQGHALLPSGACTGSHDDAWRSWR